MSMRKIYRKIAKKYGVSVAEVKRDMQDAINYTYKKSNKTDSEREAQESIESKDEIPTVEEFVRDMAFKAKNIKK